MGLLEELAKDAAKAATKQTKRAGRTTFKELKEIPTEIKTLPDEARTQDAAKILDDNPIDEFVGTRTQDIAQDNKATFAEQSKVESKIQTQQEKILQAQEQINQAPEILDATTHAQLQRQEQYLSSREAELEKLNERKRDLYLKALNLKKEKELTSLVGSYVQKGKKASEAIYDILADSPGAGRTFSNVEARTKAIYNRVNKDMYELKEALRTKNFGWKQNTELMEDVLRYLKDGNVKNKALENEVKQIADQWTKAAETIKKMRNRAGARIGKLEDWILPQSHNKRTIKKAGYKVWHDNIKGKLDIERIEAQQGKPIDDVLETAYKNITARKVESKTTGQNGANIAKRHEESRVLHFKDAESMIAYNKEFGSPDIFATMDAHLRQQSNEIAAMQILGPNPKQMFNKLKELARADGMSGIREGDLDALARVTLGEADGDNIVEMADSIVANVFGGFRSLMISSKLGSATISSLADVGNIFLGANYRGLSSIRIMGKSLQTLMQEATTVGKVGKNIELANRIGVVCDFANASLANSRFAEQAGAGILQKSAETVIRASGLGSWTTSLRASFGLELSANIFENFGKTLYKVPFGNMLKEYGITSKEWDIIRKTKPRKIKDAKFLDIDEVYAADEELGYRLSEMITNEMNAFVIEPGDRVRRFTTAGLQKGTFWGESARNATLFKSFPISVTMMHLNRMMHIQGAVGKASYAGKLIVANTVMGGMALMAYDIVTGKTTRSIDRPAFVLESIAKSGGLGIFGDFFIGMSETQYGQPFSTILMGVPAGTIDDIVKSAQDLGTKDIDKAVGNIYYRAKGYIPGQNLWYTRAVIERTIGDSINELLIPDYQKKLRRRDKALRLRGQEMMFK